MTEIETLGRDLLSNQHFDSLAFAVIDFSKNHFDSYEITESLSLPRSGNWYFDLASLTKPFSLGLAHSIFSEKFSKEMLLLLNHCGGLPAWSRLSKSSWRDYLREFSIKKSATVYSDLSALKLMDMIETIQGEGLYQICESYYNEHLRSWLNVKETINISFPETGTRFGARICGDVHDDNAFNLQEKVSHAGLFGTISGVSKFLIDWHQKLDLLGQLGKAYGHHDGSRFINGWDRVCDVNSTLAGIGCSEKTFGHLGFTGTSVWIDLEKKRGHVILTNGTQNYWYDREGLNHLRKTLGEAIWNLDQ